MKLRTVMNSALLGTLCFAASSGFGQTFTFPGFSAPGIGGPSETSSAMASVVIHCAAPAGGSSGLVPEGNCSCAEVGSGAASCSCAATTASPIPATGAQWGFETSTNFPAGAQAELTAAAGCTDAKARMESRAHGASGCHVTTIGSPASLLFVCDIPGEPF
jgi:hypothetical protein